MSLTDLYVLKQKISDSFDNTQYSFFLKSTTAYTLPNVSAFSQQWHLNNVGQNNGVAGVDINVLPVWQNYTGRNIKVGVVDSGIDYNHVEISPKYRADLDYDSRDKDNDAAASLSTDNHGTVVAGVISASASKGEVVGVAYDSELVGYRMGNTPADIQQLLLLQNNVDVSNNSWGYTQLFHDNYYKVGFAKVAAAIDNSVITGRDGLGTNFVFASGNGRKAGDNTNYHNLQNDKDVIVVAALNEKGKYADFSTPGASVLVSTPGVNILTTDRTGASGYVSGDYVSVDGTSFAAPMVSGVVALMLEANRNLGYRDVQEILAISSRQTDSTSKGWLINGADNVNGGGMHFSNDYGFGLVDATAAVRLAETWDKQSTAANLAFASANSKNVIAITDNSAVGISDSVSIGNSISIDKVEVSLNISHTWAGDIIVNLISPDGTVSNLINRAGINPDKPAGKYGLSDDNIVFTTSSNAFWGENSAGVWRLEVQDRNFRDTGTLNSWGLKVYGDIDNQNDTYFYTDEYKELSKIAGRNLLNDTVGIDTLNASAITGNSDVKLWSGATVSLGGAALRIEGLIENAYLGDGNDILNGNFADNRLNGGRGDDLITGGKGSDTFIFGVSSGRDVIADFQKGDKIDLSDLSLGIGAHNFQVFLNTKTADIAGGSIINLSAADSITLTGFAKTSLEFSDFIFV